MTSGTLVGRVKFKRPLTRSYALGASGDSFEFTCERRQVVDFEVVALGSLPH
jgi:hypothetical protein